MDKLGAAIAVAAFSVAASFSLPANADYRTGSALNWTGCYVGANAGGGWGKSEPPEVGFAQNKPQGFIGGGQFGCDYQAVTNWLVGIGGDFTWSNMKDSDFIPVPIIASDTFSTKVDWFASVTGRFGYVAGQWLIYGKAGAAWVRDDLRDIFATLGPGGNTWEGSKTLSGWTAGGGLEYVFAPNWSAFVEYDFYDFSNNVTLSSTVGGSSETFRLKQDFSIVKIGLNYRFGN